MHLQQKTCKHRTPKMVSQAGQQAAQVSTGDNAVRQGILKPSPVTLPVPQGASDIAAHALLQLVSPSIAVLMRMKRAHKLKQMRCRGKSGASVSSSARSQSAGSIHLTIASQICSENILVFKTNFTWKPHPRSYPRRYPGKEKKRKKTHPKNSKNLPNKLSVQK